MHVTVYGELRSVSVDTDIEVPFDGGRVDEAIDAVLAEYPAMERLLIDASGELAPGVRLLVDGERVGLNDDCPPDAHLQLHPMITGK